MEWGKFFFFIDTRRNLFNNITLFFVWNHDKLLWRKMESKRHFSSKIFPISSGRWQCSIGYCFNSYFLFPTFFILPSFTFHYFVLCDWAVVFYSGWLYFQFWIYLLMLVAQLISIVSKQTLFLLYLAFDRALKPRNVRGFFPLSPRTLIPLVFVASSSAM